MGRLRQNKKQKGTASLLLSLAGDQNVTSTEIDVVYCAVGVRPHKCRGCGAKFRSLRSSCTKYVRMYDAES